jgi:ribose 5-phosphate isomerase B
MKISIASDHVGFKLKECVKKYLYSLSNVEINDRGCHSTQSCDYPDYAHKVAEDIETGEFDLGILICQTGNGINMSANKWPGVRSALCWNSEIAKMARLHNDANILTLPGKYIQSEEALKAVKEFLETGFDGYHQNQVNKICKPVNENNFEFIEII